MSPEIQIVVPAFNAEAYLAPALESVLAQTFTDWALWIVDDGSTDQTLSIAEDYAKKDLRFSVLSQANAGVSAARNLGASQADTPLLIFLDADDFWEPGALAHLRAMLADRPEAPAVYGLARYIGKRGEPVDPGVCEGHQRFRLGLEGGRVIVWPDGRPTTFAVEAVMERVMTCGTLLLRRAAFLRAGQFDVTLRMWEDWDCWLRVSRLGDLIFTDTLVLGYRQHDTNVSRQLAPLEAGEWAVRLKLLETVKDDPAHLKIARQGLKYRYRCAVLHRLQAAKARLSENRPAAALREIAGAGTHLAAMLRLR